MSRLTYPSPQAPNHHSLHHHPRHQLQQPVNATSVDGSWNCNFAMLNLLFFAKLLLVLMGCHGGVDTLELFGVFYQTALKCPRLGGIPLNALTYVPFKTTAFLQQANVTKCPDSPTPLPRLQTATISNTTQTTNSNNLSMRHRWMAPETVMLQC